MATVIQQYLDAFHHHQQRLLAVQTDCWRSWWSATELLPNNSMGKLDQQLMSGASVLQASADAHHDLMLVLERWFSHRQKHWQKQLAGTPVAMAPCMAPVDLGLAGCLIMSRASRQIQHFASTRFSYATVSAVRGARRAYQRHG